MQKVSLERHVGLNLKDEDFVVDGLDLAYCQFEDCRIIYNGGAIPKMDSCEFTDCDFILGEAALRTYAYLHCLNSFAPEVVDEYLQEIKGQAPGQQPASGPVS